jgi:cytochrome c553
MTLRIMLAAALAATPLWAGAQENAAARSLAATCGQCHGTDGRSATKEVTPLAGLPKEFIVAQMKAFKDGTRPATIMHQLAKGYTDPQIELMAAYFAAQKK